MPAPAETPAPAEGLGRKRLTLQDTPCGPGPRLTPRRLCPTGHIPPQTSRSAEPVPVPGRISSLPRAEPRLETSPGIAPCLGFSSCSCRIEYPHPWGLQCRHRMGVRTFAGGLSRTPPVPCHLCDASPSCISPLLDISPADPRTKSSAEALSRSQPPIGVQAHVPLSPNPAVPTPPSGPHPRQVPVLPPGFAFPAGIWLLGTEGKLGGYFLSKSHCSCFHY